MWPPDGRRNEGTAEEHAIVLFDSLPVQAFFSWLGSFTAQPRRDTHGHQNVPSARFSRCAHGLSSLGLRNAKKETPSKRMVFLFLERATGKPPKRCLWQNKRGGFKEVSQWPVPERGRALADTTRAQLRRMHKKTPPYRWCFWSGRRGSNSLPGIPRMAVAIRRNPASPLDLTRFAQVEAASSPVLRHISKKNTPSDRMGCSFWSGRRGSNSLPRPWQGRALPDELRPQNGASGRGRTGDTRIFSPLLYQLSYRGKWRPRRGSNPRPPA